MGCPITAKKSIYFDNYEIPKIAQTELTDLLGEENVCFNRDLLSVYRAGAWGPWFRRSILPHGAVRPKNVEEIQGILKIANRDKIPVVPFSTGVHQQMALFSVILAKSLLLLLYIYG